MDKIPKVSKVIYRKVRIRELSLTYGWKQL